jgi:hypothetical protein
LKINSLPPAPGFPLYFDSNPSTATIRLHILSLASFS